MKDRWKIFWTCVALAVVLGIVIGSLTASFKKVDLREYGVLYYTVFSKVDNQTARANGNYLVGLDYGFHKFPSGIMLVEFQTMTLTKDMSMIKVEGLFTGRLIVGQVTAMYATYGTEYAHFLKASVEEYVREALEYYSLSQLVDSRQAVENNVKGLVCLQIQAEYFWIQCDHVSLGRVGANMADPQVWTADQSFELKKIELLNRQIESQKLMNFYDAGGYQILRGVERMDSQLFVDVCNLISGTLSLLPLEEKPPAAQYCLVSGKFPVLRGPLSLRL